MKTKNKNLVFIISLMAVLIISSLFYYGAFSSIEDNDFVDEKYDLCYWCDTGVLMSDYFSRCPWGTSNEPLDCFSVYDSGYEPGFWVEIQESSNFGLIMTIIAVAGAFISLWFIFKKRD